MKKAQVKKSVTIEQQDLFGLVCEFVEGGLGMVFGGKLVVFGGFFDEEGDWMGYTWDVPTGSTLAQIMEIKRDGCLGVILAGQNMIRPC